MTKAVKKLDRLIIRLAGDSGDGRQLTGDRFSQEWAAFGNTSRRRPPSRSRSGPAGTLQGADRERGSPADSVPTQCMPLGAPLDPTLQGNQ